MRACACRCTIWVHYELIYGSKIFSTVLSNIVSCSTSGGRLSSPNFEKFRNERGHSSVTLCPLHRVALHLSSVAYPPDVPRANATRSSIIPRHSASTSIPLDPSPWSKTSTPVLALPFLYPFPPLAAGALAPNTSGDLFCACPYSASFHQSVAFIQSFLRLLLDA